MKKYILSTLIFVLQASLLLPSELYGQDSNAVDTMYMNKTAEFNYETHSGVITLENFVPGEMKVAREAKPIDAILVLDFSGSMDSEYSTKENYTRVITDKRYSYLHFGSDSDGESDKKTAYANNREYKSSGQHYVKANYNGTDYQLYIVRKKGTQTAGSTYTVYRHWMFIEVGSDRIYVTPDGGFIKAKDSTTPTFDKSGWPKDVNGDVIPPSLDGNSKYNQIFCTYKTVSATTTSKALALEKAVSSFIDLISAHSATSGLTNRISMVSYQGGSNYDKLYANMEQLSNSYRTESDYLTSTKENFLVENTVDYGFNSSTFAWDKRNDERYSLCGVLKRFVDMSSPNAANILKHALTDLTKEGNTPTHAGVKIAKALMDKWGRTTETVGGKTLDVARYIIVFSDGKPTNSSSGDSFDNNGETGKTAVATIYDCKHSSTKPCLVYSIFCPASGQGDDNSNGARFMQRLSSDYPDAKTCFAGTQLTSFKYYKYASSNLAEVFSDITQEIIVETTSKYDVNTKLADFVNNEYFQLPDGVDQSTAYDNILVYENKCTGYNSTTKVYSWADFSGSGTKQLSQSDGITITITKGDKSKTGKEANDKIEIKGYDFSKNWCGMDISQTPNVAHGARLIVNIPFVYTATQVWGDLPTNTNDSGVTIKDKETGQEVEDKKYPLPTLPFCYIMLKRNGLHKGESAIYLIEKPNSTGGYDFVDKVVVNGSGNGVDSCALYGVPGEKFRVTETNWNWAYNKVTNPQEHTVDKTHEPYQLLFEFTGEHKVPDPSKSQQEQEKDPANLHNHDEAYKTNRLSLPE